MNAFELKDILLKSELGNIPAFKIIQSLCELTFSHEDNSPVIQELLLHILDRKEYFKPYQEIINSLLRKSGLFPYLMQDDLSFVDAVAYEFHKFDSDKLNVVFHRQQYEVYSFLVEGENIVLSAPTSFGKSLIIEALVSNKFYDNIVIILPTIALIDEMRRTLNKHSGYYKIITHNSQSRADKNVFLFTQERFYENEYMPKVDFFIIDEFYKLNPVVGDEDNSRCYALNKVFYRLLKSTNRFYLLGPNIENIDFRLPNDISHKFFKTDFKTVAANVVYYPGKKKESKTNRLLRLCNEVDDSTLIYCYSPSNASNVAQVLEATLSNLNDDNKNFSDWLSYNYHPDWVLVKSVKKGIAMHHGKLPRAITQFCIKRFNESNSTMKFLVCTSTMIGGVNTKAKNIVVYDNTIGANKRFDYFTFNNICGRSGRMLKHFVGNIYLFHHPPQQELPIVSPPILSQGDNAPASLLIELDNDDVKQSIRERLEAYINNEYLPLYILKKNSKYDLALQINLAKNIRNNPNSFKYLLWSGFPNAADFLATCKLLFDYKFIGPRKSAGFEDASEMARMIWQYNSCNSIGQFVKLRIGSVSDVKLVNKTIDTCLDFVRNTMSYALPNALNALDLIQTHVFNDIIFFSGSYGFFSGLIENFFQDPIYNILDEYGLPVEIAIKLNDVILPYDSIDEAIAKVAKYDLSKSNLTSFEKVWLSEIQKEL